MTTRRDVAWSYAAQFLNLTGGLVLLPAVVHYLSPPEVGLWFVFLTLAALAQLLEFGFQPTIARNTAYVYAGARSLMATGLPTGQDSQTAAPASPDPVLLADLVAASRRIYQVVSALVGLVLMGGGTWYVLSLTNPPLDSRGVLLAWLLFALGMTLQFYFGYFNGLLQGRGDVTRANQSIVASRSVLIAMGTVALIAGLGLPGLGAAALASCIAGRWVSMHYYRRGPHAIAVQGGRAAAVTRILWHNASRLGTVQLGAFLIMRSNVLIASSFIGLAAGASYGLTLTVLAALNGIASAILHVQLPRMSTLQARGQRDELRHVFSGVVVIAWALFLLGALVLLLAGPKALAAIGSQTPLLHMPALLLMTGVMALEMNHSIAAGYLTTTNRIAFVGAALLSGAAIAAGSLALVSWWGVWALIVSQGLVQLAYNNWQWPLQALRDLQLTVPELLRLGSRSAARLVMGAR